MTTLKLYDSWLNEADKKVSVFINNKRKTLSILSKKQVKEINKLIINSKVIEQKEDYTMYKLIEQGRVL